MWDSGVYVCSDRAKKRMGKKAKPEGEAEKDEKSDSAEEGLEVVSPFLLVYEEQQSVHMQKSCEPMNRIQGNTFALKIYVCCCHVHAGG